MEKGLQMTNAVVTMHVHSGGFLRVAVRIFQIMRFAVGLPLSRGQAAVAREKGPAEHETSLGRYLWCERPAFGKMILGELDNDQNQEAG